MIAVVLASRYQRFCSRAEAVIERARALGVTVLDLGLEIPEFAEGNDPDRKVWKPNGHLTPKMNQWTAKRIAEQDAFGKEGSVGMNH